VAGVRKVTKHTYRGPLIALVIVGVIVYAFISGVAWFINTHVVSTKQDRYRDTNNLLQLCDSFDEWKQKTGQDVPLLTDECDDYRNER
jgi:hypothetical protein